LFSITPLPGHLQAGVRVDVREGLRKLRVIQRIQPALVERIDG